MGPGKLLGGRKEWGASWGAKGPTAGLSDMVGFTGLM